MKQRSINNWILKPFIILVIPFQNTYFIRIKNLKKTYKCGCGKYGPYSTASALYHHIQRYHNKIPPNGSTPRNKKGRPHSKKVSAHQVFPNP